MELSLLIGPVSGAVIGYITNLVAIKMLFRPYTQKTIAGVRVPFTPGLIPKERYHLAKVVGKTISDHLLTDEVLVNALLTDDVKTKLANVLATALDRLALEDKTVSDYIGIFAGDSKENIIAAISVQGAKKVSEIANDALVELMASGITEHFVGYLKRPVASYQLDKFIDMAENMFIERGLVFLKSDRFKDMSIEIGEQLLDRLADDDRLLESYLPDGAVQQLEDLIINSGGQIMFDIVLHLMENDEVNEILKKLTGDVINNSVNKLMALFVSTDKIYESISEGITDFCKNTDNIPIVAKKVTELINKLLAYDVGTLSGKIPRQVQSDVISKVYEIADLYLINDDSVHYMAKHLRDFYTKHGGDKSIYDFLLKAEPELDQKITGMIAEKIKEYKEQYLVEISERLISKIFTVKPADLINQIPADKKSVILQSIVRNIESVVAKFLPKVITAINLPAVIEERINAFELGQAEEIILSVVDKELKAITYFGGILGLLIGLVPLILRLFGL